MDCMVNAFSIGKRAIGAGHPCFIIAEAGVNHNGDMDMARQLIDAAAEAGADAVKFQTFKADKVATRSAPKANYQLESTSGEESQQEMLRKLELNEVQHRELMAHCAWHGILFLSTPFDEESADLLESLDVAAFKIPSGEITNLPFLAHIAGKKKPVILSTGMSYLAEVEIAVKTLRDGGLESLALLHCVSNYPAAAADSNLRAMDTMAAALHVPVGYSDHTEGIEVCLAAVARGACIVEKHLTLNRHLPGPDHRASSEPEELHRLIHGIRHIEEALGHGRKEPAASEANTAAVARRSLVAAQDIPAGTVLTRELIAIKRPGTGLSPAELNRVLGKKIRSDIKESTLLSWEVLQ